MELKECYRCSSQDVFVGKSNGKENEWCVICCNCFLQTTNFPTEHSAIKFWNTRFDKWIWVDEKLPENHEFVLILWSNENLICINTINKKGEFWNGINFVKAKAWRPLPKIPKELLHK